MPKFTLKSYDYPARGNIPHLLFVLNKVPFEDKRFSQETLPAEKPKLTFGQLPVLYEDEKEYTESGPIQRFLAREFGKDKIIRHTVTVQPTKKHLQIDEVMSICKDLYAKYVIHFFEKDETAKADLKKKFDEEHAPRYIKNIETLMSKKGKERGYCVGKKLSLGDLAIFNVVEGRVSSAELAKHPCVRAIVDNVKAKPEIKAYLAKRDPKALNI